MDYGFFLITLLRFVLIRFFLNNIFSDGNGFRVRYTFILGLPNFCSSPQLKSGQMIFVTLYAINRCASILSQVKPDPEHYHR